MPNLPIRIPPIPAYHPPAPSDTPSPHGPGDAARREWAQLMGLIRPGQVRTLREANAIMRDRHGVRRPSMDPNVRSAADMQRRTRWVAAADRSLRDMETVYREFFNLRGMVREAREAMGRVENAGVWIVWNEDDERRREVFEELSQQIDAVYFPFNRWYVSTRNMRNDVQDLIDDINGVPDHQRRQWPPIGVPQRRGRR